MTKFRVTKDFLHEGDNTIISQKRWGLARFSAIFFMSHGTETFVGETLSVSLLSGIEKVDSQEGYVTILCRKISVSQ